VTLDFADVRNYEFNQECITDNLIGKAIIYGKNAIGKSNFAEALVDITYHLSLRHRRQREEYSLNVDSAEDFATFRYVFKFDSGEIDYVYRKDDEQSIIYEKLSLEDNLIFEYDYRENVGDMIGIKNLLPTLNWEVQNVDSILRYVVFNGSLDRTHPIRQLFHFVDDMLKFSGDGSHGLLLKSETIKKYLPEFETFLNEAGIECKLTILEDNDGKERLYFDSKTPLPFFKTASSGTKELYKFFYFIRGAVENGISLIVIDEFDSFYHTELAEFIVKKLEEMTDTQVILTSHNTNLLSNRFMRPDCYFILTQEKLTSFVNATKRELRQGHNLEKLYISGEFDGEIDE
jgi:hypothetical protein